MTIHRRSFLSGTAAFVAAGSLARVIGSASPVRARDCRPFTGYGDLVPDPKGLLDLPAGFSYHAFSLEGEALSDGGFVPSNHDGTAAFSAGAAGIWLVRNHEIDSEDAAEGKLPVAPRKGSTYDPEASGGTTTLLVGHDRQLKHHAVSLAGTVNNCAGGPTPWHTWLTCEETDEVLTKPHGYIFEVDPRQGGNPEPIIAMGRFEHEAVSFDRRGTAYLTEDASEPFGCIYRFAPKQRNAGIGSLHAGGELSALVVHGITTDLSIVQEAGTVLPVSWVPVPNPNPGPDDTSVREQAQSLGATPIKKAEGTWTGVDGSIWFVASYASGPDAEDPEDVTVAAHSGQIWRYDPRAKTIELVTIFPVGSPYDGPDNITASPHGFAVACTDGEDDQWLIGIGNEGGTFPFARNAQSDVEFTGATFSPDGETLFANIQEPGVTFAIWGPWQR
ncbi:MAG: alkaline phosphatase PhoX [Polyangiales bacterium]